MSEEMFAETPEEINARMIGEKIGEMVNAEATAAEAETPGDEDEEGADDEENSSQHAIMEGLGNYLEIVQANLPEGTEVRPCHFCHGFGFNPTPALQAPGIHRCDTCGGIGVVATGSLVLNNETCMCPECKGTGFVAEAPAGPAVAAVEAAPGVQMLTEAQILEIAAQARARAGVEAA